MLSSGNYKALEEKIAASVLTKCQLAVASHYKNKVSAPAMNYSMRPSWYFPEYIIVCFAEFEHLHCSKTKDSRIGTGEMLAISSPTHYETKN